MSNRSYTQIIAAINAIKVIAEDLPGVEKRSILKGKSDGLLSKAKEAGKWAFILDSECRQLQIHIEELEKKVAEMPQGEPAPENEKDKYTPNFANLWKGRDTKIDK